MYHCLKIWCLRSLSRVHYYRRCWIFYVPETHTMYFIRRCWFLKCSEEGLLVGVGGWVLLVHSEILYTYRWWLERSTGTLPWTQTLNLPPPGIEPGSPASQVGTPPKELSRQHILVLRIRDLYPEFRIPGPTFFHPGSRIWPVSILDPGSRIRIKEFKYFNPKKNKKMVSKL